MFRSKAPPSSEPPPSPTIKKLSRAGTTLHTKPHPKYTSRPPPTHSNPQRHSIFHRKDEESSQAPSSISSSPIIPQRSSTSKSSATANFRPGVPQRQNSVQTRYMNMLLAMDLIPRFHNILASFFTWVLLAGFVIFPGTFTSLSKLDPERPSAHRILEHVKNIPLLAIAGSCCGVGAAGMCWLWWRWRDNYVWLLNRIFLPGTLNSLAGLISTLINIYTQQNGAWSITARVTAIVTGSCMVVLAVLFGLYNFWVLARVRRKHGREMEMEIAYGEGHEGILEKVERKAKEPGLEPGSVV